VEPISPELVLVDPDLARVERARLTERAELAAAVDASALRLAVERTLQPEPEDASFKGDGSRSVGRSTRMLVLQALFLVALLANGVVLAIVVAGNGKDGTSREAFTAPTPAAIASETLSRQRVTGKTQVEQRILAQIVKAPQARLPTALIDASTGLAKNNLQVSCRRGRIAGSLVCVVRLAGNDGGIQAYVSYRSRPDGRGTLAWGRRR